MRATLGAAALAMTLPVASACSGAQSSLAPAGREAEKLAHLFWLLVGGAAIIWVLVMAALLYASSRRRRIYSEEAASRFILWGGAILPSAVLALLLGFVFWLTPGVRPWLTRQDAAALRIEVSAEQFWWRIRYRTAAGEEIVSANELRLPVGERVDFVLTSPDVIHSFWIPALGGKMDIIPGRTNYLSLEATKPGIYRGVCAEFCGLSHASMAFDVIVMEQAPFQTWMKEQAQPSPGATAAGQDALIRNGCLSCHRIDGIQGGNAVGPDLSHIGSRRTIAAGMLPNTEQEIARFIRHAEQIKPGSRMPSFDMLPAEDIAAMAAYLKGLR